MAAIRIHVTNRVDEPSIDEGRLSGAVRHVLELESVRSAIISIAIVDEAAICDLNSRYRKHNYPTDVLSFPLSFDNDHLEGEIVLSIDAARNEAANYGWQPSDELLLYVVHGALHLVGYDDRLPDDTARMRAKERQVLAHFGLTPDYEESSSRPTSNRLEEARLLIASTRYSLW